jgi:hypothetical protein
MGQILKTAQTPEGDIKRAAERVTLACRALSTAASDLRVAYKRSGASTVDDVAEQVRGETERVCELADELAKLGKELTLRPLAGTRES